MSKITNCTFKTCPNEQIEAAVSIPREDRSVIFGTVLDSNGAPVKDAVVKLLQVVEGCKYPYPLTHTFTDQFGQFLLGPLCPNTKYMLKIFKDDVNQRYVKLDTDCHRGACIGAQSNRNTNGRSNNESTAVNSNVTNNGCGC